ARLPGWSWSSEYRPNLIVGTSRVGKADHRLRNIKCQNARRGRTEATYPAVRMLMRVGNKQPTFPGTARLRMRLPNGTALAAGAEPRQPEDGDLCAGSTCCPCSC